MTVNKKGTAMNMQRERTVGMLHTEYVRNLNCNYERILLDKKPEEQRYQYCILSRGGIKGLLSCSLRYINGMSYLYYDISSKQTVAQLYGNRCIDRVWVVDFIWSMRRIRQELERFLLDSNNILWLPEHIFQDLDSNVFSFLYVPYYEGESGFLKLMEFLIDHIDYKDEALVECIYHMYEQLERNGEVYFQAQIYEDIKRLEREERRETAEAEEISGEVEKNADTKEDGGADEIQSRNLAGRRELAEKKADGEAHNIKRKGMKEHARVETLPEEKEEKKKFFGIFDGKKKKDREQREDFRQSMQQVMAGFAVAEETTFEEEPYGRTVYVEQKAEDAERPHRILGMDGKLLAILDKPVCSIGKKKEEVDLVLDNPSVSRIHARIVQEKGAVYLEDLNSTNGTCKNGLRLQPYEKRKLEEGDEIKCGTVILTFR